MNPYRVQAFDAVSWRKDFVDLERMSPIDAVDVIGCWERRLAQMQVAPPFHDPERPLVDYALACRIAAHEAQHREPPPRTP